MEEGFFGEESNPHKIKRAVIAGASEALKQKSREWRKTDDQIIQEITKKLDEIVENID